MQEGHIVNEDAVAALSPYLTHHINRFGRYSLDLERHPPAINYETPVVSTIVTVQGGSKKKSDMRSDEISTETSLDLIFSR